MEGIAVVILCLLNVKKKTKKTLRQNSTTPPSPQQEVFLVIDSVSLAAPHHKEGEARWSTTPTLIFQ